MTSRNTLSRRELLQHGACLAAAVSAPAAIGSCKKDRLDCTDTSGLNRAAKQLRDQLEYVDVSPHGEEKNCVNCQFYRQPPKEGQCGACTLIQGPINPAGYCNSWAPKPS